MSWDKLLRHAEVLQSSHIPVILVAKHEPTPAMRGPHELAICRVDWRL